MILASSRRRESACRVLRDSMLHSKASLVAITRGIASVKQNPHVTIAALQFVMMFLTVSAIELPGLVLE